MKRDTAERTLEEIDGLLQEKDRTPESLELLERAWIFACNAHGDQQRLSGDPHTEHLFHTAKNLSNLYMEAAVMAAGILHDTIEDTEVTYDLLEKEFGTEIAFLVDGVTKLKKQHVVDEDRYVQSLRKMLLAASRDPRIVVIKLCDRLHNMRTLQHMPPRKRKRIAIETLEIYVPAAERLSIGKIRRELEELAFPYAYPDEYEQAQTLFNLVLKERSEEAYRIRDAIVGAQDQDLIEVNVRVKGLYAFYGKLLRKENDLSQIHDITAVQIIVPSVDACYAMLGLVHRIGRPYPAKMKDFISFPRPNGYQSLRTVIQMHDELPTEIQIFTPEFFHRSLYGNTSYF